MFCVFVLSELALDGKKDDTWFSIFPIENKELIYENWEDNIIWDAEVIVLILQQLYGGIYVFRGCRDKDRI